MSGPCAKVTVRATVVALDGTRYVGTNYCLKPQVACPRAPDEGYKKCTSICQQPAHAEVNALKAAGKAASGATIYVEGHTHACLKCQVACGTSRIAEIVIGCPP